jgi:hypothetical protein
MPTALGNVHSQGRSGKHLLALSFSGFDPEAVIHVQHVSFGSVDHFVGADQDRGRDRQAERCRCSRVNHKLELRRLLNRQFCRSGTPQYLVDVGCSAAPDILDVGTIGDESAAIDERPQLVHCWKATQRGEFSNLASAAE